jgi:iron-sulfur cluster assembly protein
MEVEKYQVFVSALAAEQITKQLVARGTPNACVRLGVKGGGCSGFSYVLQYEDASKSKDLVFEVEGIHLIVDRKSILYLDGCTLDWEQSLMNQGFKFLNPNVKSQCGCGHSFSV